MALRLKYADETNENGKLKKSGDISARIGNEVMLAPKDFEFKHVEIHNNNQIENI